MLMKTLKFPTLKEISNYYSKNRKHLRRSVDLTHKLRKFSYTDQVQSKGPWNQITCICRGIVFTDAGELVHFPFEKFWNYSESLAPSYNDIIASDYHITIKYDGVLIIPFRIGDEIVFTSRGSFANEFIEDAKKVAQEKYNFQDLEWDSFFHIFEIINPRYSEQLDFLVTQYPDDDLILIGLRDKATLKLLTPPEVVAYAKKHGLRPYEIVFDCLDNMLDAKNVFTGSTEEGWVIQLDDDRMCKIKRDEYLAQFRANHGYKVNTIFDKILDDTIDEWIESLPDNKAHQIREIYEQIMVQYNTKLQEIEQAFAKLPQFEKRKEFAQYVTKHHGKLAGYLFMKLDSNDGLLREKLLLNIEKNKIYGN